MEFCKWSASRLFRVSGHLLCHPFEEMSRNRWHRVSGTGNWDTDGLRDDHLAEFFHSKSVADADPSDDSDASRVTSALSRCGMLMLLLFIGRFADTAASTWRWQAVCLTRGCGFSG